MWKTLGLDPIRPNQALRHCFGTRQAEALIADRHSTAEAQNLDAVHGAHVDRDERPICPARRGEN